MTFSSSRLLGTVTSAFTTRTTSVRSRNAIVILAGSAVWRHCDREEDHCNTFKPLRRCRRPVTSGRPREIAGRVYSLPDKRPAAETTPDAATTVTSRRLADTGKRRGQRGQARPATARWKCLGPGQRSHVLDRFTLPVVRREPTTESPRADGVAAGPTPRHGTPVAGEVGHAPWRRRTHTQTADSQTGVLFSRRADWRTLHIETSRHVRGGGISELQMCFVISGSV